VGHAVTAPAGAAVPDMSVNTQATIALHITIGRRRG